MNRWTMMVLGLMVAASGCKLTQPRVDAVSVCDNANCARNVLRTSLTSPASRQSTSTDGSSGHYMFWYQSAFQNARTSDFGMLDVTLTQDLFEGTTKSVYVAGPWVVGSSCVGTTSLGGFEGKAQLFSASTNELISEVDLLRGFYFKSVVGVSYRLHYDFKNLKDSAGNCNTLTVKIPVYMDVQ